MPHDHDHLPARLADSHLMSLDIAHTEVRESVSQTHFGEALGFASRLYGRVSLRDMRSHTAIRMFIAALGLAVREARRDPETANAMCRKSSVKAKRLEVRVARLVAGRRRSRQDQIARWANAAAYIAHPPNGDAPPPDWRQAARYIGRRGGVRRLSNLYSHRASETDRSSAHGPRTVAGEAGFPGENTTQEWYTPPHVFRLRPAWAAFRCSAE
jgi:hypothetical protein